MGARTRLRARISRLREPPATPNSWPAAAERGTVSVITHTVLLPGTIRRHEVRVSVRYESDTVLPADGVGVSTISTPGTVSASSAFAARATVSSSVPLSLTNATTGGRSWTAAGSAPSPSGRGW